MAAISAESKKKKKDKEMANLEKLGHDGILGLRNKNNTRKKDRLFAGTKFACFKVKS